MSIHITCIIINKKTTPRAVYCVNFILIDTGLAIPVGDEQVTSSMSIYNLNHYNEFANFLLRQPRVYLWTAWGKRIR